jgi:hypothetical protein
MYDLVVSTSVITVGVDFNKKGHFHNGFLILNPNTCKVRDSLQNIYRVRNYIDNNIYYFVEGNTTEMFKTKQKIKYCIEQNHNWVLDKKKSYLSEKDFNFLMDTKKDINEKTWFLDLMLDNRMETYINESFMKHCLEYFIKRQNYGHIKLEENTKTQDEKLTTEKKHIKDIGDMDIEEYSLLVKDKRTEKTQDQLSRMLKYRYMNNVGIVDNDLFHRYTDNIISIKKDVVFNPDIETNQIYKLLSFDKTTDKKTKLVKEYEQVKNTLPTLFKNGENIYRNKKTFTQGDVEDFKGFRKSLYRSSFKIKQEKRNKRNPGKTTWSIEFNPKLENDDNKEKYIQFLENKNSIINFNREDDKLIKGVIIVDI